jgi:membrane-bound serine protease (ClpP class)
MSNARVRMIGLWLVCAGVSAATGADGAGPVAPVEPAVSKKVYIVPIREDIDSPLVYVVRRGVKDAIQSNADLLVLDMDTNGGYVGVTEELIEIISKFPNETVTFVNNKAFSAGAFISVATRSIYMAPGSVIGAAAPILMTPGGGVEGTSDTMEVKMTSAISALVRAQAEKNGHNTAVVEAMIDKTKGLVIDGEEIVKEGQILTLTNTEAEREYDGRPLLSAGTVADLDALLERLGYAGAERVEIEPTGAERLGKWINSISPLLLLIGIAGLYIEFKTPGFGLPGIVGIVAFAIYFFGGYVAGLSSMLWLAVFIIGIVLVALELFVFPGTFVLGFAGVGLMLASIIMALADVYPAPPTDGFSLPTVPSWEAFELPLQTVSIGLLAGIAAIVILSRYLPESTFFRRLTPLSASGMTSVAEMERQQASAIGQEGITTSPLRPGGKAQFGDRILDAVSQGEVIPKGQKVRIIGHSGYAAVVTSVEP